ncbi:putative protein N(5)-glutamine methyltransferase [Nocardioides terrisoli]|uniref:putative protein N(5)-glutamine methyltransferase n=1 Tax=Nocardioides terrisoli TaxID=3388267 RepID=UPI00287B8E43|nr:putative protein N(5)-glutamine methyltransferase [Nocardioides marmorisolisilvae]
MSDPLVERLRAGGCVFAEDEARLLRAAASGDELDALVQRRLAGEPLEHLLGYVDFFDRRYRLSPGVFIPRQRSRLLVSTAAGIGGSTVLDLCCGCGAIGLAVRDRLDPATELVAADLDPDAVECARLNGVTEAFIGDLFDPVPLALRGRVDLLLANTPYVPSAAVADMPAESRDHEPRIAVDGGPDGMDVQRRVLAEAPYWLSDGGHLLTETSHGQADTLAGLARAVGLDAWVVRDDELGATVLVARRRE